MSTATGIVSAIRRSRPRREVGGEVRADSGDAFVVLADAVLLVHADRTNLRRVDPEVRHETGAERLDELDAGVETSGDRVAPQQGGRPRPGRPRRPTARSGSAPRRSAATQTAATGSVVRADRDGHVTAVA